MDKERQHVTNPNPDTGRYKRLRWSQKRLDSSDVPNVATGLFVLSIITALGRSKRYLCGLNERLTFWPTAQRQTAPETTESTWIRRN